MDAVRLGDVTRIYEGSDGAATLRLFAQLEALGPAGVVALNLFRAQKASSRAKVYRGGLPGRGSYRGMAYDRKQWALGNLASVLETHGSALRMTWGWKEDPEQSVHQWVLYADLPTGQVSFHSAGRGLGPEYAGEWDGVRDVAAARILAWIACLLAEEQKERS